MPAATSVVRAAPSSSGLYDVLDLILDKGLVIDAYVRVSVVGIELLTIDLRVVIASVDTYLRFAEAVDRLTLHEQNGKGLDDLMDGDGEKKDAKKGKKGDSDPREVGRGDDTGDGNSVKGALHKVRDRVAGDDDSEEDGVVQKVRKAITGDDDEKRTNGSDRRKSS